MLVQHQLSEEEKRHLRAQKFISEDEIKLQNRAKRFGIVKNETESSLAVKKIARAQRFNSAGPHPVAGNTIDEEDKLRKRAARFNIPNADLEEEKKKQRLSRFGVLAASEKDRLELRKQRFQNTLASS
eukprot:Platyproteum_vivax@DN4635_c0_g1_i2.p1